MANPNENRIDTVIKPADLTTIDAGFAQISSGLNTYTQALTDDERATLFSLAQENLVFATDALGQGKTLTAKLPLALQGMVTNLEKDLTLANQLESIDNVQLAQLVQRIHDTKRLASHEAFVGALALYKVIEAMAALGIEGFQAAYDVLKVRFAGQGGKPALPTP